MRECGCLRLLCSLEVRALEVALLELSGAGAAPWLTENRSHCGASPRPLSTNLESHVPAHEREQ